MTDPRAALEEAFKVIHPEPPKGNPLAPMWYWKVWADDDARFRHFLDAEAWTDAALMLVPEGYRWAVTSRNSACCGMDAIGPLDWSYAETPALALAAACIKAKEAGDGR